MRCFLLLFAAATTIVVLAAGPVVADTIIAITNPGFEGTSGWPKVSGGFDDSNHDIAGWTNRGSTYSDTGIDWTLGGKGAHNGGWAGYFMSSDDGAKQDVGYKIAAGDTFHLTFWSACTQTNGYLNAALYYQTGSGRVNIATTKAYAPEWTQFTLTGEAPSQAVGNVLGVAFWGGSNGGTAWPFVDDATLSVHAVPEPSCVALLASAMLGLLAYAWKKRK